MTFWSVEEQTLRAAKGQKNLAIYKGPRRIRRRLAKKILRHYGAAMRGKPLLARYDGPYRSDQINASFKTLYRPANEAAAQIWKALDDESKQKKIGEARQGVMLASLGLVGVSTLFLSQRLADRR